MPLEDATYISDLVPTNPEPTDPLRESYAHVQLLKEVLQNTFPQQVGPAQTVGGPALLTEDLTFTIGDGVGRDYTSFKAAIDDLLPKWRRGTYDKHITLEWQSADSPVADSLFYAGVDLGLFILSVDVGVDIQVDCTTWTENAFFKLEYCTTFQLGPNMVISLIGNVGADAMGRYNYCNGYIDLAYKIANASTSSFMYVVGCMFEFFFFDRAETGAPDMERAIICQNSILMDSNFLFRDVVDSNGIIFEGCFFGRIQNMQFINCESWTPLVTFTRCRGTIRNLNIFDSCTADPSGFLNQGVTAFGYCDLVIENYDVVATYGGTGYRNRVTVQSVLRFDGNCDGRFNNIAGLDWQISDGSQVWWPIGQPTQNASVTKNVLAAGGMFIDA